MRKYELEPEQNASGVCRRTDSGAIAATREATDEEIGDPGIRNAAEGVPYRQAFVSERRGPAVHNPTML
jgi:hypothetical protein